VLGLVSVSPRAPLWQFINNCAFLKYLFIIIIIIIINTIDKLQFLPHNSYAKCCRRVSVCVSVSVTLRYCIKKAKHRITQTMPHDSPMTLVFWRQRSRRNSNRITPYGGDEYRCSGLKLVTFEEKRAITRKRYKIDAQFLLKSNRKSYVLYQMAMFPTTLGDP